MKLNQRLKQAGAVPVGPNAGANERGQIKLHARQSRFFAKTAKRARAMMPKAREA